MAFNSFKKLLFGFAFSPSIRANVFEVTRLASFFNAELIFVHVGEKTTEKETEFEALLEECTLKPSDVSVFWKKGEPIKTLARCCEEFEVDL